MSLNAAYHISKPSTELPSAAQGLRHRKMLGRFDTPRPLSQTIAQWAVRNQNDRVLEPGVGAGVFIRSIITRLKELGGTAPWNNLIGFDIDPDATALLIENKTLPVSNVSTIDFLTYQKPDSENLLFDAVLGNPPYVSLHNMSEEQRISSRSSAIKAGIKVDLKASLWAFFVIHSCTLLRHNGRLAFVLPEAVIHCDYARELLVDLAKRFR